MPENTQDIDSDLPVQDEMETLKGRAAMMGLTYHPSISVAKLREKVNAAMTQDNSVQEVVEAPVASDAAKAETKGQMHMRLKNEAARLVRIRLTCMNPAKKSWPGEILSVGNSVVGTFSKFIPFNAEDGWHVPYIIYKTLVDRQCQVFVTITDSRGNKSRKGKLIKEFGVELLPDLTADELHDLAQRQAMAGSIEQ